MNVDQLKGKWMQFKGELNQQWGKFRDNYIVQSDGGYEQFAAKTQEWYGDKKNDSESGRPMVSAVSASCNMNDKTH